MLLGMSRQSTRNRPARRPRRVPHHWLFPLALAYGALMLPLWLGLAPGHAPTWHGHELLFGYALLVAAGFLITRAGLPLLIGLVCTWALARLTALAPGAFGALPAGLLFPALLAWLAGRPLWRGAKRPENRILPLLLLALLTLDAAWWLGAVMERPLLQQRTLLGTVDMFTLMMLLVGGRVLPAAVGGYLERQGIARRDHRRRAWELPLAGVTGLMLLADLTGLAGPAGLLALAAAGLALARAHAWQLEHTRRRADLWPLALGYLWLPAGLILKGLAQLGGSLPPGQALHGITVGALGTLTLVMTARTARLQRHLSLDRLTLLGPAVVLAGLAALARLAAMPALPGREALLWLAAALWSLALLLGLWLQWQAGRAA